MTDHIDVPIMATGDWIDAAWINQYIGDNVRAWRQAYTAAGMMAYALDSNTLAGLAIGTAGQMILSSGSAPVWVSGERYIPVPVNADVALTTGDYQGSFVIPRALNGWNLTHVIAIRKPGGTGVPEFQLRRIRSGVDADMLSTKVSIDSGEAWSGSAATPAVINASNDDVLEGDIIAVDVDAAGTNTFYSQVWAGFTRP